MLAACGASDPAFNGRFTEAVVNVLTADTESAVDVGTDQDQIPLDTVARRISRELRRLVDQADAFYQESVGSPLALGDEPPAAPFFPNPAYDHGARRSQSQARRAVDAGTAPFFDDVDEGLDPRHFLRTASGIGDRASEGIGCFRGRRSELSTLSEWFDGHDDTRLRVVTGSPGAGKSAMLGVLVCAAHPLLRAATRYIWTDVHRAPGPCRHLAAVHARQRSTVEIIASIGRQLGISDADHDLRTVSELLSALREAQTAPVVVLDALDEATDHQTVLTSLVMPLAEQQRFDGSPLCRLLVGTRPWPDFKSLLELADSLGGTTDLDQVDPTRLRRDLEDYVADLMRWHDPYDEPGYVAARQRFAHTVAGQLASDEYRTDERRWGEFLVAGLYANHVLARHEPVRSEEEAAELGRAVPHTLPDLLELDLASRAGTQWLRPVLAALAHARGDGMPAQTLRHAAPVFHPEREKATGPASWPAVAAALEAGRFYLRRTTDVDGTILFRLFHQGLADYLKRHPVSAAVEEAGFERGRRLFDALVAPLTTEGGRRWDHAEPYLLRHAMQHAYGEHATPTGAEHDAHTGTSYRKGPLAADAEFLVHADPATCVDSPVLWLSKERWAEIAESAEPLRRQLLALEAASQGFANAARRLCRPPGRLPLMWQPVWYRYGARVACHFEALRRTALGYADGRVEVRGWTGLGGPQPLPVHKSPVNALWTGLVSNQPVVASGDLSGDIAVRAGDGGTVYLPTSKSHARAVAALSITQLGQHTLILSTDATGRALVHRMASPPDVTRSATRVANWQGGPVQARVDAKPAASGGPTARVAFTVEGRALVATVEAETQLVVADRAGDRPSLVRYQVDAPIRAITASDAGHLAVVTDKGVVLFEPSAHLPPAEPTTPDAVTSAKLFIAGGFATGVTTAIGSVSEIAPLTTEAILTSAGVGVDDTSQVPGKTTTTVALDFGRVTFDRDLILYLFGTGGATRRWFLWDEIVRGAIGAVVLVDTRRLADSFAAVDFFEDRRLPYVVAVNCFDGQAHYSPEDIRGALALAPDVPVVLCDARSRESVKQVLISLVEYALTLLLRGRADPAPAPGSVATPARADAGLPRRTGTHPARADS
ncbi:hypothetical protein Phou_056510 [Phytohabitans houttuyneae]|uniref:Nephrocystin 3-like N-terminal domain-containing protein n=1 Tax=Phytohabitans houttuyneae TaxID=1076126 RepID=A0A6V8KG62_9ACTN|nr:hypothetical protein Phou_056510 [Phytohabitans houttuyneae]